MLNSCMTVNVHAVFLQLSVLYAEEYKIAINENIAYHIDVQLAQGFTPVPDEYREPDENAR